MIPQRVKRQNALVVIYGGDGSSPTYVTLARHPLDAHLAGAISVALGVALAVCGRTIISAERRGRGIPLWTNPPTSRRQ
jgi:hypothetical protein